MDRRVPGHAKIPGTFGCPVSASDVGLGILNITGQRVPDERPNKQRRHQPLIRRNQTGTRLQPGTGNQRLSRIPARSIRRVSAADEPSEDLKSNDSGKTALQTVFINGNKISTLIPNRIFVGGFPQNTTEEELKSFFCKYGEIKDVKIIPDKAGQAKGSYGFVTFASQEVAERIITEQAETLVFRDRKLNIGRAVKKQPLTGKSELQNTLILNTLPLSYGSVYPYQDYSYLFNQDLNALYQNYSNQLSQMNFLPAYSSSLLSSFVGNNETLGLSINPYQQLQSLLPLSMATPQSNSPFSLDSATYLNEQLSNSQPASVEANSSIDASRTVETTTISNNFQSYDNSYSQTKLHGKTPFSSLTNQMFNNISNKQEKDECEIPKKKIKHEETNTVTKCSEPIHYTFPK
uniref:Boule 2 RNA-binding protein n=2 Tax=Schmidtea mediterranea TaxID=79327 RepID=A0A172RVR3_SCHMD|nr:boule 2 RNA-binding protein [Schmidtea mediterranea]